ncbi:hypothetical protein BYT27DRAFT_7182271 [Phlegmacium glaucopus]|nr:hypothetical protein BYT27DRAFT_7182271 [Phlegmacium glaucopus]
MENDAGTLSFDLCIDAIRAALPQHLQSPRVGIVCGTGLSSIVGMFHEVVSIPYANIPGFYKSTIHGHESALAFGLLGGEDGVPVVAMLGRFHAYEGHTLSAVVFPVRVMAKLGVKDLIITNAAGSLKADISVGTIVVIQDHIALPNLTGMNPLLGRQTSPNLPRFLPLSDAYSPSLRRLAFLAAHHIKLPHSAITEGVYAWVSGPSYETAAEGKFLRNIGADVVGMSTVPEVLAAREEGLNVMVLSLVTNFVVIPETYRSIREEVRAELSGESVELPAEEVVSHGEILTVGKEKAVVMMNLIQRIVSTM